MNHRRPVAIEEKIRSNVSSGSNFKCRLIGDINRDKINEGEFSLVCKKILQPLLSNANYCQVLSLDIDSAAASIISPYLIKKGRRTFIDSDCNLEATAVFWSSPGNRNGDVVFSMRPDWTGWTSLYSVAWDPVTVVNPGAILSKSSMQKLRGLAGDAEVFVSIPAINSRTSLFTFAGRNTLIRLFDLAVANCNFWT